MKYTKNTLGDAVEQVFKILGKDAFSPAFRSEAIDALDDANMAAVALNKQKKDILKMVEDYEDVIAKIRNAAKQYSAKVAKADFDLDDKKPDEKKKLMQVRKILTDSMNDLDRQCQDSLKSVDAIEKALAGQI